MKIINKRNVFGTSYRYVVSSLLASTLILTGCQLRESSAITPEQSTNVADDAEAIYNATVAHTNDDDALADLIAPTYVEGVTDAPSARIATANAN